MRTFEPPPEEVQDDQVYAPDEHSELAFIDPFNLASLPADFAFVTEVFPTVVGQSRAGGGAGDFGWVAWRLPGGKKIQARLLRQQVVMLPAISGVQQDDESADGCHSPASKGTNRSVSCSGASTMRLILTPLPLIRRGRERSIGSRPIARTAVARPRATCSMVSLCAGSSMAPA